MARAWRLLALVMIGCGVLSITALVWAYWTASGAGTASSSVATLTHRPTSRRP